MYKSKVICFEEAVGTQKNLPETAIEVIQHCAELLANTKKVSTIICL